MGGSSTQMPYAFLAAHGTCFRLSCPYTSQQNGKAERILRTLNDCIRTLLIHSAAPASFWAEALNTATYVINRRPCRATGTVTPHQLLLGAPPAYTELRVFGCLCHPNITPTTPHKLTPRSVACVFLGYPSDHRGYRCYDMATRRVYISRHVTFVEDVFPFRNAESPTPPTPERAAVPPAAAADAPALPRCHARHGAPPPRLPQRLTRLRRFQRPTPSQHHNACWHTNNMPRRHSTSRRQCALTHRHRPKTTLLHRPRPTHPLHGAQSVHRHLLPQLQLHHHNSTPW